MNRLHFQCDPAEIQCAAERFARVLPELAYREAIEELLISNELQQRAIARGLDQTAAVNILWRRRDILAEMQLEVLISCLNTAHTEFDFHPYHSSIDIILAMGNPFREDMLDIVQSFIAVT